MTMTHGRKDVTMRTANADSGTVLQYLGIHDGREFRMGKTGN